MSKLNGCICLISARKKLLPICLLYLNKNYNYKFKYPIKIFYHGNIYDNLDYQNKIKQINNDIKYSFHKIEDKIPDNLLEKDLFYNLKNNEYAKNFGKKRIGYLHANYFWNNFMNYPELSSFDFVMRIDDDSWFKKKDATHDLFEELIKKKSNFGTGFIWNHFNKNHIETRVNLFSWTKNYIYKYNYPIKNKKMKEIIETNNEEKFHGLNWSCGNLNVYNMDMFKSEEWKIFNNEFNNYNGGYRFRWGDCEVIGIFYYIHYEDDLINFNLKNQDIYSPQLPGTNIITK